jgi:histidine ammonia-lyase
MAKAESSHVILGDGEGLTLDAIVRVARGGARVTIGEQARQRMLASRAVVDRLAAGGAAGPAVYGINTGFGALAEVRISPSQVAELQRNLVRSHAAGIGTPLPSEAVRAMMLLRAAVLAAGFSGARPLCADFLCDMLEKRVHPIIPSRGSVGASGDLAPLAHLALAMIGEGEAELDGVRMDSGKALAKVGLRPLVLEAKEGLTLLNGTQLMVGVGALAVWDAERTAKIADISGAMSLEAYKGTPRAFDPRIHAARPHAGQATAARNLARLLRDSAIVDSHKDCGKVQDPYSLRCMPQVHGATRDTLTHVRSVLQVEADSATDNPLVFPGVDGAADDIVSGGNFHGQPIALVLDFAAIAIAELANISERRIEQLVNPHLSSGLPHFLAPDSGLNSGFMIAQVAAASLVSENKILCHPASVDSIPSSAGREDHVSMGAHAALKLATVHHQVRDVLAVELLCAAQAIDFLSPLQTSAPLAGVHAAIRERVPRRAGDRPPAPDLDALARMIRSGALDHTVGPLVN